MIMQSSMTITARDKVLYRIYYAAFYKETEEDDTLSKDVQCLDIGEYSSHYYSKLSSEYFVNLTYAKRTSKKHGVTYQIIKNEPKEGMLKYSEGSFLKFIYTDSIPKLKWQMLDGDSIINNYACKKAMAELNGRTWTVWYTLDIPYSNGPWKLGGLPGLIMDARDKKGDFGFSFCGMEKGDGSPIRELEYSNGDHTYAVTPQRLQELTILMYGNSDKFFRELYGKSFFNPNDDDEGWDNNACLMEILPDTKKRKK